MPNYRLKWATTNKKHDHYAADRLMLENIEGENTEALPSSFLDGIRKSIKSGVEAE